MKYIYIELNYFKRFALNQINHFSMDITNPLNVILGSNASGKSSLLDQLTPLPPNTSDFSNQGSKVIKIEHNNQIYILSTVFTPSQKHSFLKGDEELNPGGTITVQRELVKTYFKITPDIHSLILGHEKFTDMSAPRRKEWFLELCHTNYDYAIKVYNKLKERHRDTTGALKLLKKKIISESEKLLVSDEELKIRKEVQDLHEQLNFVLEHRKPVESDLDVLFIKDNQIDAALDKLSLNVQALVKLNNYNSLSQDNLNARILHFSNKVASHRAIIEKNATEYNQNDYKIKILQKAEEQTIDSLTQEVSTLVLEINKLDRNTIYSSKEFDPYAIQNAFNSIRNILVDIFSNLPPNINQKYSRESLSNSRLDLSNLNIQKQNNVSTIESRKLKKAHLLEHKDKPDIHCPQCKFKFSLHYSQELFDAVELDIIKLQEDLDKNINPKISKLEEYISECIEYAQKWKQYVDLVRNTPILQDYWYYLNKKEIITSNPSAIINEFTYIEKDIVKQITIFEKNNLLKEKQALLTSLKDVGGSDLNALILSNKEIEKSTEEHTEALRIAIENKNKYSTILIRDKDIKALVDKINDYIKQKESICQEQVETTRRTILNEAIRDLQSCLASKEHILSSLKMQKTLIDNSILQVADLESEEKALAILVSEMSPADGLIAEGLFGFIKEFLSQMNSLIKKIWSYPLNLLPCELTEGNSVDIDYKFKVKVGVGSDPIPDVSKGSEGMMEVINLSFRITSIKYLDLQNSALSLDEVGKSFDEAHKVELVNVLKALVEQQTFSQMFIISHDYSQYTALANPDICVLNNKNILVPRGAKAINYHVKMH